MLLHSSVERSQRIPKLIVLNCGKMLQLHELAFQVPTRNVND